MYLINACHRANIGVIMDFVPVHFVRDDFSLSYFDGTPLYEYEKAVEAGELVWPRFFVIIMKML